MTPAASHIAEPDMVVVSLQLLRDVFNPIVHSQSCIAVDVSAADMC